jgi:hypothetical protein
MDETTRAYIECALWSSTDNADETGGEPLDANYGPGDLAAETLATMAREVADFAEYVEREGIDRSAWGDPAFGHDFWLTRNGHGAGFWDRGHGEPGEQLTRAAKTYGEATLYVGDDGLIYQG